MGGRLDAIALARPLVRLTALWHLPCLNQCEDQESNHTDESADDCTDERVHSITKEPAEEPAEEPTDVDHLVL